VGWPSRGIDSWGCWPHSDAEFITDWLGTGLHEGFIKANRQ